MCGRYSMTMPLEELQKMFAARGGVAFPPRAQVFPTQFAPVLVRNDSDGELELQEMKWGLVPFYDKADKPRGLINARSETAPDKAAFKKAFATRRCLVPATGFYEWAKPSRDRHHYTPAQGLFALAGLWQPHRQSDGTTIDTFAILTTAANDMLQRVHDRMPVILGSNAAGAWLAPGTDLETLRALMQPLPAADMQDENQGRASGTPKENSDDVNRE